MNMFLLWLFACGDKESITDDTGETTDTGVETDTDEETDTGEEVEVIVGTPVTFNLSDAEGMKIGLLRVDFTDDGIDFIDNKVVTSELGADASFTIGMETPTDEELSAMMPDSDTLIGMWAPYLFEDSDGDDAYTEGEAIAGVGQTWLVYSTAAIAEFNVSEGWNALKMTFSDDPPIVGDLASVPLEASLSVNESITIGGSYDTALGDRRIAVVAASTFDSESIETMFDESITDPWTLTLSGVPADNHFMQEEGFQGAMGAPLVYTDSNNSGAFEYEDLFGQTISTTVCFDGMGNMEPQPISILYYPSPTTLTDALNASIYGIGAGWNVMVNTDSDPYFPSPDEYSNMVINENCVLD